MLYAISTFAGVSYFSNGEWAGDLKFVPLDVPMDEDLQEFVFYLSAAYEMDFTFVMALIQQESGFRSDVVSATND